MSKAVKVSASVVLPVCTIIFLYLEILTFFSKKEKTFFQSLFTKSPF